MELEDECGDGAEDAALMPDSDGTRLERTGDGSGVVKVTVFATGHLPISLNPSFSLCCP